MGSGFLKKKKDARHFQEQMMQLQSSLSKQMEDFEAEGSAGNGLVTIILKGTGELKKISIKPECIDPEDIEGLETLIKAAHKEANLKIQELAQSASGLGTGGPAGLSGLAGLFG
jgi:hypothetical protein